MHKNNLDIHSFSQNWGSWLDGTASQNCTPKVLQINLMVLKLLQERLCRKETHTTQPRSSLCKLSASKSCRSHSQILCTPETPTAIKGKLGCVCNYRSFLEMGFHVQTAPRSSHGVHDQHVSTFKQSSEHLTVPHRVSKGASSSHLSHPSTISY